MNATSVKLLRGNIMIIIINTPNRNDKAELQRNANYLCKSNNHGIINFIDGLVVDDNYDKTTELNIISHGNPNDVAGIKPAQLAAAIGKYINNIHHSKGITVNQINLMACNTGREWEGKQAYAEKFAEELSQVILTSETIEVTAPNGMLVFYPNGEKAVIEDINPCKIDDNLMSEIGTINIDNIETAKEKVQPLLIKGNEFSTFNSVSVQYYVKAALHPRSKIELEDSTHRTPFFCKKDTNTFFMSNETYNWLTMQYSKIEDQYVNAQRKISSDKKNPKEDFDDLRIVIK
ncbi:hypothetical protein ACD661_11655 [Legionella lytica]|uniref:Peptidase C80 family protein n=1 Tax=Legionella lytica TaxID=96232 RepID=A0ABW8D916_9GAMM